MADIRVKRGTRAQLDLAKADSSLAQAEPYLVTDQKKFAIGTSENEYKVAAMGDIEFIISETEPANPELNTAWLDIGTPNVEFIVSDTPPVNPMPGTAWIDPTGVYVWFVGEIRAFARPNAPQGWLVCDGSAISRAAYQDLFNVIGTSYGTGDGTTTFNIPDFRGSLAVGSGSRSGQTLSATRSDTYGLKADINDVILDANEPVSNLGAVGVVYCIAYTGMK